LAAPSQVVHLLWSLLLLLLLLLFQSVGSGSHQSLGCTSSSRALGAPSFMVLLQVVHLARLICQAQAQLTLQQQQQPHLQPLSQTCLWSSQAQLLRWQLLQETPALLWACGRASSS
jgi:hypothetical protein